MNGSVYRIFLARDLLQGACGPTVGQEQQQERWAIAVEGGSSRARLTLMSSFVYASPVPSIAFALQRHNMGGSEQWVSGGATTVD